ncbi:MAG: hypothetical protein HY688_00010 [Chloroflexi bacterium]|nr:hypothetical protein [Chloroflexota bacterium]
MSDITILLERAQALRASFQLEGDCLFVEAPDPLPTDFMEELRVSKPLLREYLKAEAHWPWVLREWRRVSIPAWRQVLADSVQQRDQGREQYARWMLREVLLDPDYQEG